MSLPRYSSLLFAAVMVAALLLAAGCLSARDTASPGRNGSATSANPTSYTPNLPPYSYFENGTLKGFAVDLVEAVAAKAGHPVSLDRIRVAPWNWSEASLEALAQDGAVLFVTGRSPEQESAFKWVGPVAADHHVLFARNDSRIIVRGPSDLKNYRIGVVAGDSGIQQLVDAGVNRSRLVTEDNVSAIIAKLERGEIDLWSSPEMGGRYYAEQQTGTNDSIKAVYAFDDDEGYLAFNRSTSDATIAAFQQALDGLKQLDAANASAYDRILDPYFPPATGAKATPRPT